MPTFTFVATDQEGKPVNGVRSAGSRQEIIGKLRAENLVVTAVSEEGEGRASAGASPVSLHCRVKQSELMVFARQFGAMLKAGISLTDALHTIAHGVTNHGFRAVLLAVRTDVQRGRSLTEALRSHPSAFNQLFLSIVQAGESSGNLAGNVARLSEYISKKESFHRKLSAATLYPKIILLLFFAVTLVVFLLIMPFFKSLFEQVNATLPLMTNIFLTASMLLRNNILIILPVAVVLVVAWLFLRRRAAVQVFFDRIVLRVPFFGDIFLKAAMARLTMTLSTLLSNGIPLTDALQLATPTLGNALLEGGLRDVRRAVIRGVSLAESLGRVEAFPRLVPRMVRVGEESGTLSGMLEDIAGYYDQEVDYGLGRITSVIEPVLICAIGVLILITVLSIYLPIFSLGRAMRG